MKNVTRFPKPKTLPNDTRMYISPKAAPGFRSFFADMVEQLDAEQPPVNTSPRLREILKNHPDAPTGYSGPDDV